MKDKGVCIYYCGGSYRERLLVCCWTLRRHWSGEVCILASEGTEHEVSGIAADCQAVVVRVPQVRARRRAAYRQKPQLPEFSPYARTLLLDADTAVAGPIDELFAAPFTITHFAGWVSTGRKMRARIEGWRGISPAITALVEAQLAADYPAINTGVVGWDRGHPGLELWRKTTELGAGRPITDELAMQLVHPLIAGCRVVDDRFNCSPLYGQHRDDARIWHFHGAKHLRKQAAAGIWWPLFESAMEHNVANVAHWGLFSDPDVLARLSEQQKG